MEAFDETKCQGDVQVDIIECSNNIDSKSYDNEDPNATECSSSFGNTTSDGADGSGLSEGEAETQFFGDNDFTSTFSAFSITLQLRRKKLTNSWRDFIRPLMWRCKWTELRIREIQSQTTKYARKLAAYEKKTNSGFDTHMLEESGSKSMPFSSQQYKRKAMKRRKRKKVEETNDITSYISQHNLFSYLENKRSDLDGASAAEDFANPVIIEQNAERDDKFGISNDSILEFREGDNSLCQVLSKIEVVHSLLNKLRTQIDKVMCKNAVKFSSSENLSLLALGDAQTSSAPSPTFSAGNGDIYTSNRHLLEYDVGDLAMPESAISSYGEAVPVPDIIESTVGLLTSADVTLPQPQIGDSSEGIVDSVLIQIETAEADGTFNGIDNQLMEKYQEETGKGTQGESTGPSPILTSEPDHILKTMELKDKSTLRSCLASEVNFPRNKRKRAERKAGSSSWSRRRSGEHDSQ